MLGMDDDVGRRAAGYIADHGNNATNRLFDDISRATGARDWDAVHELERIKHRVRRAQLCDQIRDRLELSRMRPQSSDQLCRTIRERSAAARAGFM